MESSKFFQVPGHLYYIQRLAFRFTREGGKRHRSKAHWLKRHPQTLTHPKPTAISLQGELGAQMEETVRKRDLASLEAYIEGERSEFLRVPEPRVKLRIFPSPRVYMGGELGIFTSSRAYICRGEKT